MNFFFQNLNTFLQENSSGELVKKLMNLKDNNSQFDKNIRYEFCTLIVRTFVENNKCMIDADFKDITRQILIVFPKENSVSY